MILLEKLLNLAQLGENRPLFLCSEEYNRIASDLIIGLEDLLANTDPHSQIRPILAGLIAQLKEQPPNEYAIAESLLFTSEILESEDLLEHHETAIKYSQTVMRFRKRAEIYYLFSQKRSALLEKLSKEEVDAYDKKLFAHEGMMYCLEYYLAIYKQMREAANDQEVQALITSQEVNIGSGHVPGLRSDFVNDDALTKFIYSILNDKLRDRLIVEYFKMKEVATNIGTQRDTPGVYAYDFTTTSLNDILFSLKRFIQAILTSLEEIGITKVSSYFFSPYGVSPDIKSIKL